MDMETNGLGANVRQWDGQIKLGCILNDVTY